MTDLPLVAVWGAAGHARVVANGIRCQSRYEIAGFIDSVCPLRAGEEFSGSRVLGGVDCLARCRAEGISHLIVAVGDNQARLRLAEEALRHGFELAIVVHPSAVIADGVIVGGGTFVAAGVVVNPGASIGRNVILNTSCSVDHDCEIADGVHVAPGATLAGNVSVGRATLVGVGAVVRDHRSIGTNSVIGAGAVVVSDICDGVTAIGVPARLWPVAGR